MGGRKEGKKNGVGTGEGGICICVCVCGIIIECGREVRPEGLADETEWTRKSKKGEERRERKKEKKNCVNHKLVFNKF